MQPRLWLLATLTGCTVEYYDPPDDSGMIEDTGWDAAADSGDWSEAGAPKDEVDPDRPVIESADAWCYLHQTGDERLIWSATATATDPQGVETLTLMTTNGISIFEDGETVDSQALVCEADGLCTASWASDATLVDCQQPESYTLVFTVLDEDAKRSAPFEVVGRMGSGPEG